MAKQPNHQQFQCCYKDWVSQQRLDLDDMLQALIHYPKDLDYLRSITRKVTKHFEDYSNSRAQLAKRDGPSFIAPSWGTTFENSFLWIGGCRPTLMVRLVYALCGSELEAHLSDFLQGVRHGNLGELSSSQLKDIDFLHVKTIKMEDNLSSRTASLQELIADDPLVLLANSCKEVGESNADVDKIMDDYALGLSSLLVEADKLRLATLKGLLDILTPLQGVELLVASQKLHLSIHEWSKRRDLQMGITCVLNDNKYPSTSDSAPGHDVVPGAGSG